MRAGFFRDSIQVDFSLRVVKRGENWFWQITDESSSVLISVDKGREDTEELAIAAAKAALAESLGSIVKRVEGMIRKIKSDDDGLEWE